jgi:hypothetical protein
MKLRRTSIFLGKNRKMILILLVIFLFFFICIFAFNVIYRQNKVVTCNQPYALCPAAKCIPDPLNSNNAYCICDVANGVNYSYGNKTCDEIAPYEGNLGEQYIYSTFSPSLLAQGYEAINCPSKGINLNCMNKKCSIDPHNPKQSICNCSITNNHGQKWTTLNKKNTSSSCNYLSGASTEMENKLMQFINNK